MEPDFSGWATKAGLKCSDGITIMPDAFKHQDQMTVPLVWQHGHTDVENVLGHVLLTNKAEGVWVDAFFNGTAKAVHSKEAVRHKDLKFMSIWANQLIKRSGQVLHGVIREVSLVLAGANPGATIESVTIQHGDGSQDVLDDDAIIHTGLEIEIKHDSADDMMSGTDDPEEEKTESDEERTVEAVYQDMTDEQQAVVHYFIAKALEESGTQDDTVQHDDDTGKDNNNSDKEGKDNMGKHNVFEGGKGGKEGATLVHDALNAVVKTAADTKANSLRDLLQQAYIEHGIDDINTLFPFPTDIDGAIPEFVKRPNQWVTPFLDACRKSPFSRIRSRSADLTYDEARAKGYIKGHLKKEQFIRLAQRVTTPGTVYKKQKLDRDDIIDITDFDVVVWIQTEMRFMLEEEVAGAALIGDGREIGDENKIPDGSLDGVGIRPIAFDDEFYSVQVNVNVGDALSSMNEVIDAMISNRYLYLGAGTPNFYTTEYWIARFLTLRDSLGHRYFRTLADLAAELRVGQVVPVTVMSRTPDIIGIMVDPSDYTFGSTKGGQITNFDFFDIDYNQYKYLIETRLCGTLTKHRTAMVFNSVASGDVQVTPLAPDFDVETGEVTINDTTHVTYKHGVTTITNSGGPYTVTDDVPYTVTATPDSGYFFPNSVDDSWTFLKRS